MASKKEHGASAHLSFFPVASIISPFIYCAFSTSPSKSFITSMHSTCFQPKLIICIASVTLNSVKDLCYFSSFFTHRTITTHLILIWCLHKGVQLLPHTLFKHSVTKHTQTVIFPRQEDVLGYPIGNSGPIWQCIVSDANGGT